MNIYVVDHRNRETFADLVVWRGNDLNAAKKEADNYRYCSERDGYETDVHIVAATAYEDGDYSHLDDLDGTPWECLAECERKILLLNASCADGISGDTLGGDGKCIIDLGLYPFSVSGEKIAGEIKISPAAIIYNSEG